MPSVLTFAWSRFVSFDMLGRSVNSGLWCLWASFQLFLFHQLKTLQILTRNSSEFGSVGMSRGMCTFLCFCWKYTKTWHGLVLSPPYLWINLASLERKICHNSTCQINKTLDKSWETSWTNNQSCTRDSWGIALRARGQFWGGSSHLWTSEGWSDAWLLLESVVCVNESSESLSKSQAQGNSQYTIYWFILYVVSLHTHNTLFTIRS